MEYDSHEADYRDTIYTLETEKNQLAVELLTIQTTHNEQMAQQHSKLEAMDASLKQSRKGSSGLAMRNIELKSDLEELTSEHHDLRDKWSVSRQISVSRIAKYLA